MKIDSTQASRQEASRRGIAGVDLSQYLDPSTPDFRNLYRYLIFGLQLADWERRAGSPENRAEAPASALQVVYAFLRECGLSEHLLPLWEIMSGQVDAAAKRKSGRAPKIRTADRDRRLYRAALMTALVQRGASLERAKKQVSMYYDLTASELKRLITFRDNARKGNLGAFQRDFLKTMVESLVGDPSLVLYRLTDPPSPRQHELAKQFGWVK